MPILAATIRSTRWALLGMVMLVVGSEALAESLGCRTGEVACACPDVDVWSVNTRCLPCIDHMPDHADPEIEQRVNGCWEPSNLEALLDDPSRPLVIFIHGNRYKDSEAKAHGVTLARRLEPCGGRSARMVVLSWPSDQQGRLIPSSRSSYRRASTDGHYLAWLLSRVPSTQPVGIIGYSFGALVAAEALDDVATTPPADGAVPWVLRDGRTNLVLVAPALRCDAISPRGAYAAATSAVHRLTLVINSRDLALRMFPHLDKEAHSEALGAVGMPVRWLPDGVEYASTDAAPVVGTRHALPEYLRSKTLLHRIATGAVVGLTVE